MCRFHAYGVHQILKERGGFTDLEYIMRLDDDGEITEPLGYDLFRLMKINHFKYGFVNTVQDDKVH